MTDRISNNTKKQIAEALRRRVLDLSPSDLGREEHSCADFLGGVVEFAADTHVHSLVVLSDGSVSLYDSEGHGSLGCGSQPEVQAEAARIRTALRAILPICRSSVDRSLPAAGTIRCHVLSGGGRRSIDTRLALLATAHDSIRSLYFAAQRMISLIDRVQAGQSLADEIELAYSALEEEGGERCWSVGNVAHRLRI